MINKFIEYYKNNEANLLHSILLSAKGSKVENKESMGGRSSVTLINNLGWITITFINKKLYALHIVFDICNIVTSFDTQEIKINKKIKKTAQELYKQYFGDNNESN